MNSFNQLLQTISQAPKDEMDPELAKRVKGLQGGDKEIVATELKEIREIIVKDPSKGSPFALWVLDETIAIAETK